MADHGETDAVGDAAFSLTEGGPVHAAFVRAGLAGGARGRLVMAALVLTVGWLPLVILSALEGTAVGGAHGVPLFADLGPWVRFFVVVPLLILAEPVADVILGDAVVTVRASGLVREDDRERFERAVGRAQRFATSDTAEALILVAALLLPHALTASLPAVMQGVSTWFGAVQDHVLALTPAGRWYAWVSAPLVQFLLLRWAWRTVAWWGFLWRVSRLPLALRPAHPDRAGGLGLLAFAPNAFVPVFMAVSALGAVAVSTQIRLGGRHLAEVAPEVVALVVLEVAVLLVPQLFFVPLLLRARKRSLIAYGVAGMAMARRFDEEWMGLEPAKRGALLDSSHASATTDFAGTYGLVAAMRPAGISLVEVIRIVIPLLIPFAPLLLFEYSVKEILRGALQLVR